MRYKYFLINMLFSVVSIFASGNIEIPKEYIDIGQLDLTKNKQFDTIFLPYIKPLDIDKIITSSVQGLIIDKIIVDRKTIHPQKIVFDMGAYEATSYKHEQNVNNNEEHFLMPINWYTNDHSRRTYDEALNEGIYFDYYSRNGKLKYSPDKYHIPYGSKEVFIFYRIRFPNYSKTNEVMNFIVSDRLYIAKFNILWPSLALADRNGKITLPEEYHFLGIYELNSDNELVVDLPIEWPTIEKFNPYIDNRWLIMYQLIGDGILLREEKLNIMEKNKIDILINSVEVEFKKIIKMKWRKNSDGIVFYNNEKPNIKYTIPYGCKEIYMTYDILFKKSIGYVNYNKRLCVKWEIKWN
jgi:hypothetical protein